MPRVVNQAISGLDSTVFALNEIGLLHEENQVRSHARIQSIQQYIVTQYKRRFSSYEHVTTVILETLSRNGLIQSLMIHLIQKHTEAQISIFFLYEHVTTGILETLGRNGNNNC